MAGFSQEGEFFISSGGVFVPGASGGLGRPPQDFMLGAGGSLPFNPTIDLNFALGEYFGVNGPPTSFLTTSNSGGTNLLPTLPSGYVYTIFAANTPRITLGSGLLVEESRTNNLLNSTAPVTQTTASLVAGTYTLWVNGTGSATSSAGTAVGSGFGAATQGNPNTITITTAGTVVVTVTGALNTFQLELGAFGTSLIVTTSLVVTRAADVVTLTSPPAFGSAYSLFGFGTPQSLASSGNPQVLVSADDGTTNNRIITYRSQPNGLSRMNVQAAGVALLDYSPPQVWQPNTPGKMGVSYASGAQVGVYNGGTPGTASSAAVPAAFTGVSIGSHTSTFSWDGTINRIAIWPTTALSGAQLQQITT